MLPRRKDKARNHRLLALFLLSALALAWSFSAAVTAPIHADGPLSVEPVASRPAPQPQENQTAPRLTRFFNQLRLLYDLHALTNGDARPISTSPAPEQ